MNLDKTNLGGKTETWVILMLKIFVLQKLHGIFDFELEKQCIY